MATKLKQTRLFDVVLEACKGANGEGRDILKYEDMSAFLSDYAQEVPNYYWAIQHYCDTSDDGEIERIHWHIVFEYQSRKTYTGVIRDLADLLLVSDNRISVDPCRSKVASIRYLMHLDDPDKAPYLPSDVLTNHYPMLVEAISRNWEELTIEDIVDVVKNAHNEMDVITRIGLKNYQRYRSTINDVYKALKVPH